MNQQHEDLRAIHDKLTAIHHRLREMLEALLAGQAKTNDLLALIAETLKSIDAKTPDQVDIESDGVTVTASQKEPKS